MDKTKLQNALQYFKLTTMLNEGLDLQEEHHMALKLIENELNKIESNKQFEWIGSKKCSNCGSYIPTDNCKDYIPYEDNRYCYYCGCEMNIKESECK